MHVAIVNDRRSLNAHYRAFQPVETLANRGQLTFSLHHPDDTDFAGSLSKADIVLVHRFADDRLRRTLTHLRAGGVAIVWDNDDDITAIPRSNPLYRRFGGVHGRRLATDIGKMVRLADVVTTPSEVLANRFREQGAADVRVLENYLPVEFLRPTSTERRGVTLVWVAALEHSADRDALGMGDVMAGLLEAHPDLRILSVGLGLGLRSARYEHIPFVEFADLVQTIASGDIGLAPLVDIPWNRARSNVKLKEYGVANMAWLASPVGAYVGMGEKQGGRLVADDGWREEIDRLVVNKRSRAKLAKHAQKWARGQTIDKHADQWLSAFRHAILSAQAAAARSAT